MLAAECKKRIESAKSLLGKGSVLLLSSGPDSSNVNPSFYYFTGLDIDGCLLAISQDSHSLICPEMNRLYAGENMPGSMGLLVYKDRAGFSKSLKSAMGGAGRLLLDYPSTRLSFAESLCKITKARREDFSGQIAKLRAVKSGYERECLQKSVTEAESLLSFLESGISEGMTEKKIESMLLGEMLSRNLKPSFAPIISSGANSSMPHSHPTGNKVKCHVLVDMGVKVEGYCSDLTRCFFFNSGRMQKNAYDKLTLVCDEICDRAASGGFSKASELAAESALLLERYGLPSLPHSIGHGIGLEVHESPSLGLKSKDALSKGMALAIEPAAYYPGRFGVRCERDVFL
ncbi:MAG: M24 family metallopeptidase [Candidatus Micrarchaeia archaeon]